MRDVRPINERAASFLFLKKALFRPIGTGEPIQEQLIIIADLYRSDFVERAHESNNGRLN